MSPHFRRLERDRGRALAIAQHAIDSCKPHLNIALSGTSYLQDLNNPIYYIYPIIPL